MSIVSLIVEICYNGYMRQRGFTVIEILFVAAFLIAAAVVLFIQLDKISIQDFNNQKKTAINAIYFSLEEGFYPVNGHYPEVIEDDTLKTMDSALLTDPYDIRLGEPGSAYRYEPKGCKDGKCSAYTLRATLDGESDFVKESRNK